MKKKLFRWIASKFWYWSLEPETKSIIKFYKIKYKRSELNNIDNLVANLKKDNLWNSIDVYQVSYEGSLINIKVK